MGKEHGSPDDTHESREELQDSTGGKSSESKHALRSMNEDEQALCASAISQLSTAIADNVPEDELIDLLADLLTGKPHVDIIIKGFTRRSLLLRDHRQALSKKGKKGKE